MNKFLLKKPIVTEKSSKASETGKYTFMVKDEANKVGLKKILEKTYKVKIIGINILNTQKKQKRVGRFIGFKPGYKKAIVTLKAGEKITNIG